MSLTITLPSENINDGVSFLHQTSVKETFRLHNHDFYEFFYIVKGKAIHNVNGENRILSQGDFVLIRPNDMHKYEFLDNFDFEIISVGYSASNYKSAISMLELADDYFTTSALPPIVNLYRYNYSDIYQKLCKITKIPIGNERKMYFKSILPFLLYTFVTYSNKASHSQPPQWFVNVIDEMSKPENYIAGLSRLIELSHSSQEHITREFRRHLNITPTEFINIKRISHAARLISDGKISNTEICFECGFNNLSHFYHCFKKQYGCSPKQFLSEQLNND